MYEEVSGMKPVLMDDPIAHYITCREGNDTGRIIRAYG
jgi:hypothetical protein